MYFSSHVLKNVCPLELEGITSVVIVLNDCANSCYKQDDSPPMDSWKFNDPPSTKGSKTDVPPPQYYLTSPLEEVLLDPHTNISKRIFS